MSAGRRQVVVVGYDDSQGAQAALRFAVEEARLRSARLRLVHVWHVPTAVYAADIAPVVDVGASIEQQAEEVLRRAVDSIGAADGLEVESEVVEGVPADVLVRRAADADLLVVGSRGLGGFGGLLLGSVSQQVAHHAPCPVVIVRPPAAG